MGSYPIHCYARPPNDIPVGPGHSQLSPWSLLLDWALSCPVYCHRMLCSGHTVLGSSLAHLRPAWLFCPSAFWSLMCCCCPSPHRVWCTPTLTSSLSSASVVVQLDVSHHHPVLLTHTFLFTCMPMSPRSTLRGSVSIFLLLFTHYGNSVIVKYVNGWALMHFRW